MILQDHIEIREAGQLPLRAVPFPVRETIKDRQQQGHEHEKHIEDRLRQQERQDQLASCSLKHSTSLSTSRTPLCEPARTGACALYSFRAWVSAWLRPPSAPGTYPGCRLSA